jgi:pyruvate dehydrogenase E1 component
MTGFVDPQETQEWLDALDALDSVLEHEGPDRAHFLLERLIDKARRSGAYLPYSANTAYLNTIPLTKQEPFPGDQSMERRIRSFVRWNAMAMVVQANRKATNSAGTSPASPPARPCSTSASTTSSAHRRWSRRRPDLLPGPLGPGHLRPAFLEGRLTARNSWTTSARRSTATGCRPTRTPG